ncbi:hypothetical protein V8C34DRAFT_303147 [Trichoderma compactum]
MLLSNRTIDQPETYAFGKCDSLMVTDFIEGIGIESYRAEYEMGDGTFYRGENLVRMKGSQKGLEVHVIEVFHTQKKQILWFWSRDLNGFQGTEFEKLQGVTKSRETRRLYWKWQDTWFEIAEAQKGELGVAINKITNMELKAEEILTTRDEKSGIELRVVYLEHIRDYAVMRRGYSN